MKTVKVRIAVAVDPEGEWNSCGWSKSDDKDCRSIAIEGVAPGEVLYWLEADLPLPEEHVMTPTVVADDS